MARLTKRTVDAAKPDGRDYFLWDEDLPGFGLRVFASGAKSYLIQYRVGRTVRRFTIGPHGAFTPDEARSRAAKLLQTVRDGGDPSAEKKDRLKAETVAELADLYLGPDGRAARPRKKESSWTQDTSCIRRHILPLLGRKVARNLTAEDIERFQADVAAGKTATDEKTGFRGRAIVKGGKGVAARAVSSLSAMLAYGVSRKLFATNPAQGVVLYKGEKKERPLGPSEVATLARGLAILEDLGMVSPSMAAAIKLLLLTGARKGEITNLRWEYVDLEGGRLNLPDSKTGAKVIPLPAAAARIIADLPRRSEWVLPSTRSDGPIVGLQKTWEMTREWCGIDAVRLHDLRHSFATYAVSDGASLYLVGKALGHKQSRTTERYAHVADDPVKAVMDRTADHLAALMEIDANLGGEVIKMTKRLK
ncbi:tyrosine-type recombinase/integrase [Magnetospirillum molischianum]|uniref:Putative Phage integrase family protein n=1 Tax=Magnetospirillum molischianum DSM 120 TaxID=1150626 RepID=H8FTV3_MAGML|nr:site-specific integrase [Magnetospirillum molischianum]CCG41810.1 putative Phage integrase family protein [Magnetospirillum molischianum DSM 120]